MNPTNQNFNLEENIKKFEYIGNFFSKTGNTNLIGFNYTANKEVLSKKNGRVYFFIENKNGNKKILKIGKSSSKSGIKGTLNFYSDALSGTPGQNRFCIHHLIKEKLDSGSEIEVYSIFSNSIKTQITGFTSTSFIEIPLDMTYVEKLYLDDYKNNFGEFPEWNFQENNKKLPNNLMESFGSFIVNKKQKK